MRTHIMWSILISVCVEKHSEPSKIVFTSKNWTYENRIRTTSAALVLKNITQYKTTQNSYFNCSSRMGHWQHYKCIRLFNTRHHHNRVSTMMYLNTASIISVFSLTVTGKKTDSMLCLPFQQFIYLHSQQRCSSCLLYTSPSPRDGLLSRMPSSA